MNASSLLRGQPVSVCASILGDGRRWTAHSIRNTCLREHARILSRMLEHDTGKAAPLLPFLSRLIPMIETRTPLLTQVRRAKLNSVPVLTRLAAHHQDWIRDPESWEPDLSLAPRDLLVSLIEHLLMRYPLPRFCRNAWFIEGPLAHIERNWYIHLAQGGNLRAYPLWKPQLTRRAAHEFLSAPDHFLLREAVRYGQANAIFDDPALSRAIAKSRIGQDFHHDELWLPFFQCWANARRSNDEFFLVLDYLWALTREKTVHDIGLAGRTVDSLVRSAGRFFQELVRAEFPPEEEEEDGLPRQDFPLPSDRNYLLDQMVNRWEPLPGVGVFRSKRFGWQWLIYELTSPRELAAEGNDMAHCVGGYGWWCRRGISSIFSLKSCEIGEDNFDREVTIEVLRKSRQLFEARAWKNRYPHKHSRRVILEWCRKNDIHPGGGW